MLSRSSLTDEELGKRDDNYRPAHKHSTSSPWLPAGASDPSIHPILRGRRRRILVVCLVAVGVYLFVRHMPITDVALDRQRMAGGRARPGFHNSATGGGSANYPQPPTGAPPDAGASSRGAGRWSPTAEEHEHYYSGPIKFYNLRASLDAISETGGKRDGNRNVLFAASSLRSAANLLPLVCDMAGREMNNVHLVLLGREALGLDDVLRVNGLDRDKECKNAFFHDGRPDYSEYSTDVRAEASVVGAMNHVNAWMHPQVVIVDDEKVEDPFFTRGIRGKMRDLQRPLIEIPAGQYDDFGWITRLDSASLSSWHKPRIEILIRSPPHGGGGLLRLLKSLSAANFGGFRTPRLTVEISPKTEGYLQDFLRDFSWPPVENGLPGGIDLLKLQRRVSSAALGAEEASVRLVESYYPSHGADDHVLLLSSDAVVSPQMWHYLMSMLLQSRYSAFGSRDRERLSGVALAAPPHLLDGTSKFSPPTMDNVRRKIKQKSSIESPPFLWPAAEADAMLIFGNRWAEFHDYLTRRLHALHKDPKIARPKRMLSLNQPAWLEFFHELIRARAYTFLYPADSDAGTWVTLHNELHQPPEESLTAKRKIKDTSSDRPPPASSNTEPFLTGDLPGSTSPTKPEKALLHSAQPLHALLPFDGALPPLSSLPLLTLSGAPLSSSADDDELKAMAAYVRTLRTTIGGCSEIEAEQIRKRQADRAGDLFCYVGKEAEEWELPGLDMDVFREGERAVERQHGVVDRDRLGDEEEDDLGSSGDERGGKPVGPSGAKAGAKVERQGSQKTSGRSHVVEEEGDTAKETKGRKVEKDKTTTTGSAKGNEADAADKQKTAAPKSKNDMAAAAVAEEDEADTPPVRRDGA